VGHSRQHGHLLRQAMNSILAPFDLNTPGFNQTVYAYPNLNGTDLRISDGCPRPQPAAPSLTSPTAALSRNHDEPNLRTGLCRPVQFTMQREIFRNTVWRQAT